MEENKNQKQSKNWLTDTIDNVACSLTEVGVVVAKGIKRGAEKTADYMGSVAEGTTSCLGEAAKVVADGATFVAKAVVETAGDGLDGL
ncbi:MAG: hypothetical protein FWE45_03570 [Firmicutes bacterium]|nr:hypothetical protein [Bacillota bacterium]